MRLVFAGTPEPAVPSLSALLESSRHEVVAVVTRPDAPSGRGRTLRRSPVGALADEAGVPVLTPEHGRATPRSSPRSASSGPTAARWSPTAPSCPGRPSTCPRHGWVNLHFSLLPAWRGAAPVQAALRHGDDITGATTFLLEEGLDTGPVFGVVTEAVRADDTAGALLRRLANSGATLLSATLDGIADGSLTPAPAAGRGRLARPEGDGGRRRASTGPRRPRRSTGSSRSVTPEPGAWTTFRDERLGIGPVRPAADAPELKPGELHAEKRRVLVGTGGAPLELGEVRPVGKRAMPAPDWARGVRIEPGELLR